MSSQNTFSGPCPTCLKSAEYTRDVLNMPQDRITLQSSYTYSGTLSQGSEPNGKHLSRDKETPVFPSLSLQQANELDLENPLVFRRCLHFWLQILTFLLPLRHDFYSFLFCSAPGVFSSFTPRLFFSMGGAPRICRLKVFSPNGHSKVWIETAKNSRQATLHPSLPQCNILIFINCRE